MSAPAVAAADDSASLLSLASEYVSWEENASYRSLVSSWIASKNLSEIRSHFVPRIAFGTAGLRARMAPGYKHMNPLVITQTSQGFVRYIEAQYAATLAEAKERGLVLGYDGRHNSRRYAEIVAAIFLAAGFRVHLFSRMVGTPMVPFGLLHLKAIAGVVITASHNPKEDNGFKVYWTNGAQIIPPHDAGIAASIRENLKPWHAQGADVTPLAFDASHARLSDPFEEVTGAYFKRSGEEYCWRREQNQALAQQTCPVTYTAMHGVGAPFTARAFAAFGLPAYIPTPAQIDADPEFPTVRFPNPEEGKGALKLAMETADQSGSKLILANDPDADRLAVAEKVGDEWLPLNGNQIALLLASWTFENYVAREKPTKEQMAKTCMAASTVSSAVLASMAAKEGFNFYPTLTGFKWMGNRACQAVSEGERFLFAFEVEIGFLVGNLSYDKDGIRMAAIFYEMYAALQAQGKTCVQRLQELYERYGFFNMNTSYFFCDAASGKLDAIFARLRNYPGTEGTYPAAAGPHKIRSVRDVTLGFDSSQPGGKSLLPTDRSSQMLTFTFENGTSATLRNSGTEPKLKYYIECRAEESAEAAAELTKEMSKWIIEEFIQPVQNGLEAPKQ